MITSGGVKTREILISSISAAGLFLAAAAFPLLSFPIMLFLIAPTLALAASGGLLPAVLSAGAASVLLALLLHPLLAAVYLVSFGAAGAAIGIAAVRTASSPGEALTRCITVSIVCKLAAVALVYALTGTNMMSPDPVQIAGAIDTMMGAELPVMSDSEASAVRSNIQSVVQYVSMLVPFGLILFCSVECFASITIVSFRRKRRGCRPLVEMPRLSAWSFPKNVILVLIAALLADLLAPEEGASEIIQQAGLNLIALSRMIFMIQGLAVCSFFIERFKLPKFIQITVIIGSILFSFLGDIVSVAGIADLGLNIRGRTKEGR